MSNSSLRIHLASFASGHQSGPGRCVHRNQRMLAGPAKRNANANSSRNCGSDRGCIRLRTPIHRVGRRQRSPAKGDGRQMYRKRPLRLSDEASFQRLDMGHLHPLLASDRCPIAHQRFRKAERVRCLVLLPSRQVRSSGFPIRHLTGRRRRALFDTQPGTPPLHRRSPARFSVAPPDVNPPSRRGYRCAFRQQGTSVLLGNSLEGYPLRPEFPNLAGLI